MLSDSLLMKNPGLAYSQVFTGFLPFLSYRAKHAKNQAEIKIFTSTSDICPYTPLSAIFLDILPVLSTPNPCISTSALSPPLLCGAIPQWYPWGNSLCPGSLLTSISPAWARRKGKIRGLKRTIKNWFRWWQSNTHCQHSCVHLCLLCACKVQGDNTAKEDRVSSGWLRRLSGGGIRGQGQDSSSALGLCQDEAMGWKDLTSEACPRIKLYTWCTNVTVLIVVCHPTRL